MRVRIQHQFGRIDALRWVLVLFGLAALGFCGYVYLDAELYQSYQNWAFDEQLHGRHPSVRAYLADSTPLRRVLRRRVVDEEQREMASGDVPEQASAPAVNPIHPNHSPVREAVERALIGRIEIPRLRVTAIVQEGDDESTLRRAVGHLPDTPRPGQKGNVALAGHRDTFFRALRNVRKNDRIAIQTLDGDYHYVIESTKIVTPDDLRVLRPGNGNTLTLVTCYPFSYVGHAPKRFIVQARQVDDAPKPLKKGSQVTEASAAAPVSTP